MGTLGGRIHVVEECLEVLNHIAWFWRVRDMGVPDNAEVE